LQQHFSFLRRAIRGGAEHQHFPVQAKRTHAESVFFEYVKQTCSGSPLYICFVQINYVKATNQATLLELPGFVFGADAAAPLFFLNTVLCRSSSLKQERDMPLSVSAAWQHRSEQKRKFFPNYGVSHPAG
jgi:hypothetical protein